MKYESLCLCVVRSVLRAFVGFRGGFPLFFFLSCRTPWSVPLSEAQGCRFFFAHFRPADALLISEPGGDQSTLFARNVVQGYVRVCVLSFIFCVLYLFHFVFSSEDFPPSGAVGVANFHPGYLSFPRLTPRLADIQREVFRMTSLLC